MGTRSRIGYELPDNSVISSYCHWHGYPEHNGKVLVQHYQSREDVKELIDGGSMSSLRTRETWNNRTILKDEEGKYITDSDGYFMYENDREPQPLYHHERGDGEEPTHTSFKQFLSGNSCEEYAYLYTLRGCWKCYDINNKGKEVEISQHVTV